MRGRPAGAVVVRGRGELDDLEAEFGRRTGRQPWLDVVLAAIPGLPMGWHGRAAAVDGPWNNLSVRRLSASDLIASKLKAFRPHDRRDIEFLCTVSSDVRAELAALNAGDYWTEEDIWEETIRPRRDRVLDYLDGRIRRL